MRDVFVGSAEWNTGNLCDVSAAGARRVSCAVRDLSGGRTRRNPWIVCDVPGGRAEWNAGTMCDVSNLGTWRESGSVCNGRRTRAEGMRPASDDADTGSGAGRN